MKWIYKSIILSVLFLFCIGVCAADSDDNRLVINNTTNLNDTISNNASFLLNMVYQRIILVI